MVRYIRYCENCVMPETKPDLHIDEQGICSACRNMEKRVDVDWNARRDRTKGPYSIWLSERRGLTERRRYRPLLHTITCLGGISKRPYSAGAWIGNVLQDS